MQEAVTLAVAVLERAPSGAPGGGGTGTATPPLIEARPFVLRDPKTLAEAGLDLWHASDPQVRLGDVRTVRQRQVHPDDRRGLGDCHRPAIARDHAAQTRAGLVLERRGSVRRAGATGRGGLPALRHRRGRAGRLAVHQQRARSKLRGRPSPPRTSNGTTIAIPDGRRAGGDDLRQADRRGDDRPVHLVASRCRRTTTTPSTSWPRPGP